MSDNSYTTIDLSIDANGVADVVLARPEKHNAMNEAMILELTHCFETLAERQDVRVIVLSAQGKTFCAGGDLDWMRNQFALDRAGKIAGAKKLSNMLLTLDLSPKITIAKVQGNAFGGGLGLMSVCDIAIAVDDAKFGFTETRLGLIPATIGPFVAAKLGNSFGRQVFFSGKMFGTGFCVSSGLIAQSVSEDAFEGAAEKAVQTALQTSPGATASAKALLRTLNGGVDQAMIDQTIEALADCWESQETQAGITAFFAKQTMPWASDK